MLVVFQFNFIVIWQTTKTDMLCTHQHLMYMSLRLTTMYTSLSSVWVALNKCTLCMYTHIIMHPMYSHPAGLSNTNQTHLFLLGREEDMRYWTQVAYRTQIPCFQIRSLLYRLYGNAIGSGTGRGGAVGAQFPHKIDSGRHVVQAFMIYQ